MNFYLIYVAFLPGLFVHPQVGGHKFLRNVDSLSTDYMALYPRRQNSSEPPLREPQILHGTQQVGPADKASALYSGGDRFESWPGHQLS
jgi:hypothetical protein